jgi:hypothetical protein
MLLKVKMRAIKRSEVRSPSQEPFHRLSSCLGYSWWSYCRCCCRYVRQQQLRHFSCGIVQHGRRGLLSVVVGLSMRSVFFSLNQSAGSFDAVNRNFTVRTVHPRSGEKRSRSYSDESSGEGSTDRYDSPGAADGLQTSSFGLNFIEDFDPCSLQNFRPWWGSDARTVRFQKRSTGRQLRFCVLFCFASTPAS